MGRWPPTFRLAGGPVNRGPFFSASGMATGSGNPRVETNLRTGAYTWTVSLAGTNEYYALLGAGNPSLPLPNSVIINGLTAVKGSALGSLAASQWQYGDNDTLGFSTVYVRLSDGADPDSKIDGFVRMMA